MDINLHEDVLNVHEGFDNIDFNIGDREARLISEIVSYQALYRVCYEDLEVIRFTHNPNEIAGMVRVYHNMDTFEFKLSIG